MTISTKMMQYIPELLYYIAFSSFPNICHKMYKVVLNIRVALTITAMSLCWSRHESRWLLIFPQQSYTYRLTTATEKRLRK